MFTLFDVEILKRTIPPPRNFTHALDDFTSKQNSTFYYNKIVSRTI